MLVIELALIIGLMWFILLLIELVYDRKWGPAWFQNAAAKFFSSFLIGILTHLFLFCTFYGLIGYLIVQMSPLFKLEIFLFWSFGGIAAAISLIQVVRIRTNETWLLRRWLLKDLKESEDPEGDLDTLLCKIESSEEQESSRKILAVLREISVRGNSEAALVRKALENHRLL